jgi:hypothetical protein
MQVLLVSANNRTCTFCKKSIPKDRPSLGSGDSEACEFCWHKLETLIGVQYLEHTY